MLILSIWFTFSSYISTVTSSTCGFDNSPVPHAYEGIAYMETYPWLGFLIYPYNAVKQRFTTAVVLVTRQMVIATAFEIDKFPKIDFRRRARVVVGRNCSSGPIVPIRSYTYHPDYSKDTFSAIALIQLETDDVTITLRPICPPPKVQFRKERFFAMVLSEDCNRSKMRIHKMMIVPTKECQNFYRRTELDLESLWPTHTTCARSVKAGECVWRSGAVLVEKLGERWSLLGFGVYGPGCQAPARFLDYGMYHEWVKRSVQRIGRPAITKMSQNHVVLRRSLSKVQRFGPCEKDEMVKELYTDTTEVQRKPDPMGKLSPGVSHFNLTIVGDVEYSCVVLRADNNARITSGVHDTPILRLRRYCSGVGQTGECFTGVQFIKIEFLVEIRFKIGLVYSVKAYGRRVRAIDPTKAHKYANRFVNRFPSFLKFSDTKAKFKERIGNEHYPLYGKKTMKSRAVTENESTTTTTTTSTTKP